MVQDSKELETRDSVALELRDTVMEVTTVTIDRNEKGDTLRVTKITDRTRARNRDRIVTQTTKTMFKTDTVYIATRDSVFVKNGKYQSDGIALHSTLKWIFWIIVGVIALLIILKIR